MNASFADQLQKLQSLVGPAADGQELQHPHPQQPQQPYPPHLQGGGGGGDGEAPGVVRRTHGALTGYADDGALIESWTSGGAPSVPGRPSGADSTLETSGGDGPDPGDGFSGAPPLHPQARAGPVTGVGLRDTMQSWATTLSAEGPSRASPRTTIRPISPVIPAASGAPTPRDSAYSRLAVLPDRFRGASPRPSSAADRDPGLAVTATAAGPGLSGRSPRGGSGSQQIQDQLARNREIQEQIARLGEQLAGAAMSAAGLELPPDLAATLAGLAASVRSSERLWRACRVAAVGSSTVYGVLVLVAPPCLSVGCRCKGGKCWSVTQAPLGLCTEYLTDAMQVLYHVCARASRTDLAATAPIVFPRGPPPRPARRAPRFRPARCAPWSSSWWG
jgi:hypothetical protein